MVPWPHLREQLACLHPRHRHVGVDDCRQPWFHEGSIANCEAVLHHGRIADARACLCYGAPASCRQRLWRLALGFPQMSERWAHRVDLNLVGFVALYNIMHSGPRAISVLLSP